MYMYEDNNLVCGNVEKVWSVGPFTLTK